MVIRSIARLLEDEREALAETISAETGKSPADAGAEVDAATEFAYFMAGEGRRFYGKTMPSATPNRQAFTIRQPLGVAGVIVAANTPLTNIAWKVFPALLCGNAVVLKASEHAPLTALAFARLAVRAGLSPGFSISSTGTGRMQACRSPQIHASTSSRSRARLPSGGPSRGWPVPALQRSRSRSAGRTRSSSATMPTSHAQPKRRRSRVLHAGQRCASGSRLIVFAGVYDEFTARLLARLDADPPGGVGPVMTEQQLERILVALDRARDVGARVLTGGERLAARVSSSSRRSSRTFRRTATSSVASSSARSPRSTVCARSRRR